MIAALILVYLCVTMWVYGHAIGPYTSKFEYACVPFWPIIWSLFIIAMVIIGIGYAGYYSFAGFKWVYRKLTHEKDQVVLR